MTASTVGVVVMYLDVVRFSLLSPAEQFAVVRGLSEPLPSWLAELDAEYTVGSTGDGFVLVVQRRADDRTLAVRLLRLADRLVNMSKDIGARVRIGFDAGDAVFRFDAWTCTNQAAGTPLNRCARIVGVGDADQVVASMDFWSLVPVESQGWKVFKEYSVLVKHDEEVRIALAKGPAFVTQPPQRIVRLAYVDAILCDHLAEVAEGFRGEFGPCVASLWRRGRYAGRTAGLRTQHGLDRLKEDPASIRWHCTSLDAANPIGAAFRVGSESSCLVFPEGEVAYRMAMAEVGLSDDEDAPFEAGREVRSLAAIGLCGRLRGKPLPVDLVLTLESSLVLPLDDVDRLLRRADAAHGESLHLAWMARSS